jgi:uncharacterized protein (TIGR02996 family)
MSPEELAFIEHIRDNFDDDAPRLVYADWLEEQGQIDKAQFIRLDCERARFDSEDLRWLEWYEKGMYLRKGYPNRWFDPLPAFALDNADFFFSTERGFVDYLSLIRDQIPEDLDDLLQFAPLLHKLQLQDSSDEVIERLSDWPGLSRISEFDLRSFSQRAPAKGLFSSPFLTKIKALVGYDLAMEMSDIEALTRSKACQHLQRLSLMKCRIDPEMSCVLVRWPGIGNVKDLTLSWNQINDQTISDLANSRFPIQVEELNIGSNPISIAGIDALVASRHFRSLRFLSVDTLRLGPSLPEVLATWPALRSIRSLWIGDNQITDRGLETLLGSNFIEKLESLHLEQSSLTSDGILALVNSSVLEGITRLNLSRNSLGDEGIERLLNSPLLNRLQSLNLAETEMGDSGFRGLFHSRFSNLQELSLSYNSITDESICQFATLPFWKNLRTLWLVGTEVTARGAQALMDSPHFHESVRLYIFSRKIDPKVLSQLEQLNKKRAE